MGFYFDGSGQRTHRYELDDLDREDREPFRPSPGKSSRTHGGSDVLGIPGKISLTARLAQRIDRYARTGHHATPDEHARAAVAQALGSTGQPLPDAVRHSLEAHAGTSLEDVHVHTGPESARAAEALDAEVLRHYAHEWILEIMDMRDFVAAQRRYTDDLDALVIPRKEVYPVSDSETARWLDLDAVQSACLYG